MKKQNSQSPTINNFWVDLKRRLKQSAEGIKQSMKPNINRQTYILEDRAHKLAQKKTIEDPKEKIAVVKFKLANEQYGLECIYAREVFRFKQMTPIPGIPDFVLGIINVRGEIISVIDLKIFFQMPVKGLTDLTRVIIISHPEKIMEFGILAEEVLGTLSISKRSLHPPPSTFNGIQTQYLKGVTRNGLIIIDALKLLIDPKMIVNQQERSSTEGGT